MSDTPDNSTIRENLGGAMPPIVIEYGKRKLKGRLLLQEPQAEFEEWLRQDYRASALRTTKSEAKADHMTTVADMKKAFRWGGPLCCEMMNSEDGGVALAAIAFGCSEADMLELMKAKGSEVQAAMDKLIRESFPDRFIKRAPADPNGQAEADENGSPSPSSQESAVSIFS